MGEVSESDNPLGAALDRRTAWTYQSGRSPSPSLVGVHRLWALPAIPNAKLPRESGVGGGEGGER